MFTNETNGYNKKEVDKKINSLLQANIEKDKLNLGLASALDKSKQIELSAKNLYELKIQKILILYRSMEKSLLDLFKLYPQIEEFEDIKQTFEEFSKTVEASLNPQPENTINSPVSTENDTIRLLLNKMSSYSKTTAPTVMPTRKTVSLKRNDIKETPQEKPTLIKPIFNTEFIKKDGKEDYESLADKFLESNEPTSSVYEKIINTKVENDLYPTPNESGFDLKEAVNPKDDLMEIMKSFNLDD